MSFSSLEIIPQTLYTTLITKLKKYQAALKKAKGLIKNFVAHKHQPTIEEKTAKEIWEVLKAKF